jgi:hypothetical protein
MQASPQGPNNARISGAGRSRAEATAARPGRSAAASGLMRAHTALACQAETPGIQQARRAIYGLMKMSLPLLGIGHPYSSVEIVKLAIARKTPVVNEAESTFMH